jgi:hypothetical protein
MPSGVNTFVGFNAQPKENKQRDKKHAVPQAFVELSVVSMTTKNLRSFNYLFWEEWYIEHTGAIMR